jgi:hypothetical protein
MLVTCSDSGRDDKNCFWSKGVSMAGGESGKGLYDHLYRRFFEQRESHDGYLFQEAPGGSAPTPVVTFGEKLRWWTWNRGRRQKKILAERDRLQREILQIKKSGNTK